MDEPANGIRGNQPEEPEDQEDDSNSPKHRFLCLRFAAVNFGSTLVPLGPSSTRLGTIPIRSIPARHRLGQRQPRAAVGALFLSLFGGDFVVS